MGPSVTTVYLPGQLMGLRCVVTLSSYSTAGYERVSQTESGRGRLVCGHEDSQTIMLKRVQFFSLHVLSRSEVVGFILKCMLTVWVSEHFG